MSAFVPYREHVHVHNELVDALVRLLGQGRVLTNLVELSAYAYDASLERGQPDVVALPESADEVAQIVRLASAHGVPVVARGAGTSLSGGPVAPEGGIVVHLSRMNTVHELDINNRCAVVGPGVVNNTINELAAPYGLHYAPDPSSFRVSTIGGNIAENSGGLHALKYGVTSHHVLGLEVVTPTGEIITCGSKAHGLLEQDLTGLLCGSEGTLGITTRALVRLTPLPEALETILATYDAVGPAADTVSEIIGRGFVPAALEMMDRATIEVVEESTGVTYAPGAHAALIIEVDGERETIARQRDRIVAICRQFGCLSVEATDDPVERDRLWHGRRAAYAALARLGEAMIVCDGTVPRDTLGEIVPAMEELAGRYGLQYSNTFHAGDGNLHPKLMFDERNPRSQMAMRIVSRRILEMCVEAGGTITGEHGVGSEKTEALGLVFGPREMDLMRRVRRCFDREARFNPGKTFDVPPSPPRQMPRLGAGDLATRLREIVGDDGFCEDSAPLEALALDGLTPGMAVRPADAEQVAAALRACRSSGAAVVPLGRRTRASGYGSLQAYDVALLTDGLSTVRGFRARNLTLTAGAGLTVGAAREVVGSAGLRLPIAFEHDRATLGGVLAANASGPGEWAHGPLKHRVLGIEVALGDGTLVELGGICMKNVAGYDLMKLLIGSQGTMGVICEVTLRLAPAPAEAQRVEAGYGDLDSAWASARRLLGLPFELDEVEIESSVSAHERPWRVSVVIAGEAEDMVRRVRIVEDALTAGGGVCGEGFGRARPAAADLLLELRVAPADGGKALAAVCALVERCGFATHMSAGAGTGLAQVAVSSLPDAGDFVRDLTRVAHELGGQTVVVHGSPEARCAWAAAVAAPPAIQWMLRLKHAFDPDGILSPGRVPWLIYA